MMCREGLLVSPPEGLRLCLGGAALHAGRGLRGHQAPLEVQLDSTMPTTSSSDQPGRVREMGAAPSSGATLTWVLT